MKKNEALMDAKDLACYIKKYYDNSPLAKGECTDIIIQKCLYFLFAYWGAYISKGKKSDNFEVKNQNMFLFDNKIEAWEYGPVVPDVYFANKRNEFDDCSISDDELFKGNVLLRETINGLLDDLVSISPFKLVTISHQDQCWITNYRKKTEKGLKSQEINKRDIINEYECKI